MVSILSAWKHLGKNAAEHEFKYQVEMMNLRHSATVEAIDFPRQARLFFDRVSTFVWEVPPCGRQRMTLVRP